MLVALQQPAEGVDAAQQRGDHRGVDDVEVLEAFLVRVGERGQRVAADDRGVAFQRVHAAEKLAPRLHVLGRVFEREQSGLERGEVVGGLDREGGREVVEIQISVNHVVPSSV